MPRNRADFYPFSRVSPYNTHTQQCVSRRTGAKCVEQSQTLENRLETGKSFFLKLIFKKFWYQMRQKM